MRGTSLDMLLVIAALCPLGVTAQGIDGLISVAESADGYRARVAYEVTMPAFSEPVSYEVTVAQNPSPTDTLSPCSYLIEWTLHGPSGDRQGWSAYFDGHHYRYGEGRLQEYHLDWDARPFGVGLRDGANSGVQRNAQFTELLPSYIAKKLREIVSDSSYTHTYHPDTLIAGQRRQAEKALKRYRGYDACEWLYVADKDSSLPVSLVIENNPGSISEQSLNITYNQLPSSPLTLSDQWLEERYPEQFDSGRESLYKVENLRGQPLPGFSAPTITGERYSRRKGEPMRAPTVVALLEAAAGDPAAVVRMTREALARLPMDSDVIWAFMSNNADEIETLTGSARPGEHTLMNCRALARSCGVATAPVLLIVDSGGIVKDLVIGFNNNLVTDVIQKMALTKAP